jgi:hypothetical protein
MICLAKVKFDLRNPNELYSAQREIDSLLGTKTKFVKTIASLIKEKPFNLLEDEVIRLITRLVYMGEGQGYLAEMPIREITSIVKKATFFRETYVFFEAENNVKILKELLNGVGITIGNEQLENEKIEPNPYTQIFLKNLSEKSKLVTIRFLPFQTLFEYATEVRKLPAAVFRPKNSKNWGDYFKEKETRTFLLTLLSQKIIEYSEKRRGWDVINPFKSYVEDRYLTLYATKNLARILGVNFNEAKVTIIKGDSTNMSMIENKSIDGILTSPPYFDALDYIGNNKVSILILGLDEDLNWESTKQFYEAKYRDEEKYEILPLFVSERYFSIQLPSSSLKLIKLLQESRRAYKSSVVENYLKMMKLSFEECYRVLQNNKYYLMVVSKYHRWIINGQEQTIETSSILADLGKSVDFKIVDVIEHGLSKADKGKIGVEDILVFQK